MGVELKSDLTLGSNTVRCAFQSEHWQQRRLEGHRPGLGRSVRGLLNLVACKHEPSF